MVWTGEYEIPTGVQPQNHHVCLTEAKAGSSQCKNNGLQPCISDFAMVPGSGKRASLHARQGMCSGEAGGKINSGAERVAESPQKGF